MRIGERIARRRRALSLTQEQLAERAGVSVETIRKLERGERDSARMMTLNRLARALDVPTSALVGGAAPAAARREPDFDELALLDLRRVLTPAAGLGGTVAAGPTVDRPPTLGQLADAVRRVDRLYHADDYATALDMLPGVLAGAQAAVDVADGDDRAIALGLLAQAHQVTGTVLIQIRSLDLAHRALSAGLAAAEGAGSEVLGSSLVTTMCWLLLRQGRHVEAEQLAITTADAVQPGLGPGADPVAVATWGWLLLRAAAAASRDNRPDDATAMLDAAAAAAARIGERTSEELAPGVVTIGAFGATTVAMKRVEAAVVAGDPGRALALARHVHSAPRPTSDNRHRHLLDVAWASVEAGRDAEAVARLMEIRAEAPTWLRHQRYAHDIVNRLMTRRRRAASRELAALAAMVGITD